MKKSAFYLIIFLVTMIFIFTVSCVSDDNISPTNKSYIEKGYQDITTFNYPLSEHGVNPVQGCTSFCMSNPISCVFGTNCDYVVFTSGQLFVNKRNVIKSSRETGTTGKRAEWISKFGSLTFNFIGFQMPWAGMNEAGLVISTMNLPGTKTPVPDQRPPLNSGFWIQYQLDNCATVEEVIASDERIRIAPTERDHYLICDKKGTCAVIEFLDGKMVYYTGRNLPVNVLANSTYEESLNAWRKNKLFGDSLPRFALAADELEKKYLFAGNKATVYYAFYILSLISRPYTVWSIVFDNQELQLYFVSKRNQQMRQIDFGKLDFSSETPVRMLDVHAPLAGDISNDLLPYSHQSCLRHLKNSFSVFAPGVPDEEIESLLNFFENFIYAKSIQSSSQQ